MENDASTPVDVDPTRLDRPWVLPSGWTTKGGGAGENGSLANGCKGRKRMGTRGGSRSLPRSMGEEHNGTFEGESDLDADWSKRVATRRRTSSSIGTVRTTSTSEPYVSDDTTEDVDVERV